METTPNRQQTPADGEAALALAAEHRARRRSGLRLTLLFNGLLLLWLLARPAPLPAIQCVDNIAQFLGPLLMLAWSFASFRGRKSSERSQPPRGRERFRQRGATLLLSAGVFCFAAGQIAWTVYEQILHRPTPTPSLVDIGFISAYPCMFLGVLLLPLRQMNLMQRARALLDSLMILISLAMLSWRFLIGPRFFLSDEPLLARLLGISYALCDLSLLFSLLLLTLRDRSAQTLAGLRLLAAGTAILVVTDSIFHYLTLHNQYATGLWTDTGWPLGYMLVGLGAHLVGWAEPAAKEAPQSDAPNAAPLEMASLSRALLPYALVPIALLLPAYNAFASDHHPIEMGLYIGVLALIGAILLRQVCAIQDNRMLYRCLQETYRQLEATHRQEQDFTAHITQMNEELVMMQAELVANNFALSDANARLEALATTDGMTGLANHRAFQERLRAERERCARKGLPLSLLMVDVDLFKQYNDAYGHQAGDAVLRGAARLLLADVRESDLVARYGGEEFAIILPEADSEAARQAAERLRAAVEAHAFAHRSITLSIGAACLEDGAESAESLIHRADTALYAAKRAGRNRVALEPCQPAASPETENDLLPAA